MFKKREIAKIEAKKEKLVKMDVFFLSNCPSSGAVLSAIPFVSFRQWNSFSACPVLIKACVHGQIYTRVVQ